MTNIVHIIPEPPNIKNNIKKVEKRIKEASYEISKAKGELNNANHSELSYEINQLESMYKQTNQYASEFETFASKVETMVNEYITADKNCAKQIRSNGKSHRQKTGLPKGLGSALISSSFEKLGDIIEDVTDPIKKFVKEIWENYPATMYIDDILRGISELPFVEFFVENWKEFAGILGNMLQIVLGVCAMATPAGLVPGIISIVMGIDKLVGSVVYDRESWFVKNVLSSVLPDWLTEFVYDGVDIISSGILGKVGKALSKIDDVVLAIDKLQDILGNINKWKSYLDIIMNDGDGLFEHIGNKTYKDLWKLPIKDISYYGKLGTA